MRCRGYCSHTALKGLGPVRRARSTFVGGCVVGVAAASEHHTSLPRPALACSLVDGVMTYEMTRFVIDAQKAVVHKAQPDQKVWQHGGLREGDDYQPVGCMGLGGPEGSGARGAARPESGGAASATVLPLSLWLASFSPPACLPFPPRLRTWSLRRARCTPSTAWCPPARESPSERVASHTDCQRQGVSATSPATAVERTSSEPFKQDSDVEGVLAT